MYGSFDMQRVRGCWEGLCKGKGSVIVSEVKFECAYVYSLNLENLGAWAILQAQVISS